MQISSYFNTHQLPYIAWLLVVYGGAYLYQPLIALYILKYAALAFLISTATPLVALAIRHQKFKKVIAAILAYGLILLSMATLYSLHFGVIIPSIFVLVSAEKMLPIYLGIIDLATLNYMYSIFVGNIVINRPGASAGRVKKIKDYILDKIEDVRLNTEFTLTALTIVTLMFPLIWPVSTAMNAALLILNGSLWLSFCIALNDFRSAERPSSIQWAMVGQLAFKLLLIILPILSLVTSISPVTYFFAFGVSGSYDQARYNYSLASNSVSSWAALNTTLGSFFSQLLPCMQAVGLVASSICFANALRPRAYDYETHPPESLIQEAENDIQKTGLVH